jgi:hypothetical protein
MVLMAELATFLLIAVGFASWFRRRPLWRAHRRHGVVPSRGQFSGAATPTYYGARLNVPTVRPELRPDDDATPRGWSRWRRRSEQGTDDA